MRDVEREAEATKRQARIGEFIEALHNGRGTKGLTNGKLISVRMRLATEENPDTLLVVKAVEGTAGVVAFVGASSIGQALLTWRARSMKGGLRWREDRPYGG